jgi:hypothetical protein
MPFKSFFQKIALAIKHNPRLSFAAFSIAFVLILLSIHIVDRYIVNEPIKESAKFVGTTQVWERTRGNRAEYFFKMNYEYAVDSKSYQFHFEEEFRNKGEAELAIKRCDKSDLIIWYNKKEPNVIRFSDPENLLFSSFFIHLYIIAFLVLLWLLFNTIIKLSKYFDRELANQSFETSRNSEVILSKNLVSGFRIKFVIQFTLIFLIGVYFNESVEWIAIVSWMIISIELTDNILKGLYHNHLIVEECSLEYSKALQRTLKKFGDILKEHFGMKGSGPIDINSIGIVLFLIVFIYLPFIVLPLLAINLLRLIVDLIFFISNKICSTFLSFLIKENMSSYEKIIVAFSYSITFVGLLVSFIYLSVNYTTLIK